MTERKYMIRYNTSNDKVSKVIREWCKENNYIYSFETDEREREFFVYPFTIVAPSYAEEELIERIRTKTG